MTFLSSHGAEQAQTATPQVRVFVGLKIAPEIATELAHLAAPLEKLPVRLVKPADVHLTLVAPWSEASIPDAIEKLGRLAPRFGAFLLVFQHAGYGPRPLRPRLLWVDCAATDEITTLHSALLRAYGQTDERPFRPHITLARLRANGPAITRRHPIDRPLSLAQRIELIELFQSPQSGGTGYRILASLRLGETVGTAPTP